MNNYVHVKTDDLYRPNARFTPERQGYQVLTPFGKLGYSREFSGKKLRELTVHHKDHDHDNNPPDGSNWELLCLYCHDNEHERHQVADAYGPLSPGEEHPTSTYKPFAGLADVLKRNT